MTNRASEANCDGACNASKDRLETGAGHLEKVEGGKQNRDGGIQVFKYVTILAEVFRIRLIDLFHYNLTTTYNYLMIFFLKCFFLFSIPLKKNSIVSWLCIIQIFSLLNSMCTSIKMF